VYHDVTSGSNGGETAGPGWDYASGFGSIIVSNLNSSL
jgi:pseudomonalisin/xanthomonalisin